jgi:hypothetical protein
MTLQWNCPGGDRYHVDKRTLFEVEVDWPFVPRVGDRVCTVHVVGYDRGDGDLLVAEVMCGTGDEAMMPYISLMDDGEEYGLHTERLEAQAEAALGFEGDGDLHFSHVEVASGETPDTYSLALMRGRGRVGGKPNASLDDVHRVIDIVFGAKRSEGKGEPTKKPGVDKDGGCDDPSCADCYEQPEQPTQEEFDAILQEITDECGYMSVPLVYEALSEHYNNHVLVEWKARNE